MAPPRTFGVEEELLLWDATTGALLPLAGEIVRAVGEGDPGDPEIKHEFFLEQVEVATRPCSTAEELRGQLQRARDLVAAAAARPLGAVPAASSARFRCTCTSRTKKRPSSATRRQRQLAVLAWIGHRLRELAFAAVGALAQQWAAGAVR